MRRTSLNVMRRSHDGRVYTVNAKSKRLDDIDFQLLRLLQHDSRQTQRRIGEAVGLTSSAVCDRIKRLETAGFILGYRATLAPALLTGQLDFLVRLHLAPAPLERFRAFEMDLKASLNTLSAIRTGAPGVYLLRLVSRNSLQTLEHASARYGLIVMQLETLPIIAEIVAYRDPPIARSRAACDDVAP